MNDAFSGKNSKVKVMYVRSEYGRNKNKPSAGKGRSANNSHSSREDQTKALDGRDSCGAGSHGSEGEHSRRPALSRSADRGGYDSPWKTVSRVPD